MWEQTRLLLLRALSLQEQQNQMDSQNRNLSFTGDIPVDNRTDGAESHARESVMHMGVSETGLGLCPVLRISTGFPEDNSAREWLSRFSQLQGSSLNSTTAISGLYPKSIPFSALISWRDYPSGENCHQHQPLILYPLQWEFPQQKAPLSISNTAGRLLSYVSNNQCHLCHLCWVYQHSPWESHEKVSGESR